jgi:signal transduction histidine kinase
LSKFDDDTLTPPEKGKFLDKAFLLISNLKNSEKNRDEIYNIISKYYIIGNWGKYKQAAKLLLDQSISSKDTLGLAKGYRSYGNFYNQRQVLDSAFYFFSKSEKFYKDVNDLDGYSTMLLKKGVIQYNINDYLAADLSLSTAYNFAKKSNDKIKIYGILNQLGLVSNQLGEYDKAIFYLNEALRILNVNNLESSGDEESICLSNMGLVYESKKDFKKAIEYYNLSLRNNNLRNENPNLYSNIIDNLSYAKLKIKDFENLPKLFFESLKIRDSLDYSSSVVISNIHLSEYYYKIKDTVRAIQFVNKSIAEAQKSNIPQDIVLALKQASVIDKINASKYSDNYIRINDSLLNVERNSKDRFARIQLETDEIIEQKDQLEEKNRNILNYFMGAIVIGGFLFFIRIQRSRARELALTQSQQQANEEIYRLIISHQNQLEEGRELEKRRISKELHDGVLGRLFGLRLNLDGLNNIDDDEAKQQRLDYLNELQLIEQDLRDISHELNRENLVLINNFVAIINNLLEQQAKINPAKVKSIIAVDIDWDLVPNTSKINLYRILQEALQNINKYAKASTILIHFRKDKKGNLLFNIEDDGVGYDVNSKKSKGIGIKNIVSRTQQCNGIIDIKSEIGKGSKIIITFPLENKTIKI